jgi:transcriptional repressor NrdR
LRALDPVAYVRFASVYQDFEDLNSFIRTIEQLENERLPS